MNQVDIKRTVVLALPPAMGFLLGITGVHHWIPLRFLLLLIGFMLLYAGLDLFNRRSTRIDDSGAWIDRRRFLAYLLMAAVLLMAPFRVDTVGCFFVVCALVFLYDNHFTRMKYTPVVSTLVFFLINLAAFSLGFSAAGGLNVAGVMLGIFFAAIYAAGQLNGELIQFDHDSEQGKKTNVAAFGADRVMNFVLMTFSGATIYLLILSLAGLIRYRYSLPFVVASALVIAFVFYRKKQSDPQSAIELQVLYRVAFAIAGLVYLVVRFLD